MDKTSFYVLLSSFAVSALTGCDEECPHSVVLAKKEVEVDAEAACDSLTLVQGQILDYGVSKEDCAELCDDARMNTCRLDDDYWIAFREGNRPPVAGSSKECPEWDDAVTVRCSREKTEGKFHEGCPIAGRRPTGLLAARRRARDAVADFLARAAHLEAASVCAFDKLAEDLSRLGAPAELIDECLRAARDETEHAQVMGRLARRRGACPPGVDVIAHGNASAFELALENVVEGVVREAYGALQASVGGHKARDPEVRAALAGIAEDEAAHAWLALRVADWLDGRLTADERVRVREAKRGAIWALRLEIEGEPEAGLRDEVGLPSRAEAVRLFVKLERTVWAEGAAA